MTEVQVSGGSGCWAMSYPCDLGLGCHFGSVCSSAAGEKGLLCSPLGSDPNQGGFNLQRVSVSVGVSPIRSRQCGASLVTTRLVPFYRRHFSGTNLTTPILPAFRSASWAQSPPLQTPVLAFASDPARPPPLPAPRLHMEAVVRAHLVSGARSPGRGLSLGHCPPPAVL